ncbi:MAG: hypothetical protein Q8P88_00245 [Candidatus Jorgensenbacteria bacterium]|nr:hypothetical protein [Candidatus Jorgensenbacteria bacterium]
MEKAFAILLVISFAGIALFGFSAASAPPAGGLSGTHVGCVADMFRALQGSACPVTKSPFSLLTSHLAALQGFVGNTTLGFLVLLSLIAGALFLFSKHVAPPSFSFTSSHEYAAVWSRAVGKYIRWTALHETSPTLRS